MPRLTYGVDSCGYVTEICLNSSSASVVLPERIMPTARLKSACARGGISAGGTPVAPLPAAEPVAPAAPVDPAAATLPLSAVDPAAAAGSFLVPESEVATVEHAINPVVSAAHVNAYNTWRARRPPCAAHGECTALTRTLRPPCASHET